MQLQVIKVQDGNTVKIFALDQDYVENPGNRNSIRAENRYLPRDAGLTIQCNCELCQSLRNRPIPTDSPQTYALFTGLRSN